METGTQRHPNRMPRDGDRDLESGISRPRSTKNCWQPPEAGREAWNRFSLRASRMNQPCQHLDFGILASLIGKEYISVVWSHTVCGDFFYGSPRKRIHFLLGIVSKLDHCFLLKVAFLFQKSPLKKLILLLSVKVELSYVIADKPVRWWIHTVLMPTHTGCSC